MEKKNLSKKQELAQDLGLKFDEVAELFSEETLETMRMVNAVGGSEEPGVDYLGCDDPDTHCAGRNSTCLGTKLLCPCDLIDRTCSPTTPSTTPPGSLPFPEPPTPTIAPITSAPPKFPSERPTTPGK